MSTKSLNIKELARRAMLTLLLVFVITTAWAQGSVSYRAYNVSTNQFEDGVAASPTAVTEETTAMSDGWYVVSGNVNVSGRIEVTGTVNLILCDGATLTATQGLHVPTGVTLNIYGQSDGSGGLTATQGGSDQAGIGGNNGEVSGTITIHGGNVTSTGGWSGAGIGGGHNQPCGSITIYGGTVNAHGGDRAAGIGGGTGEYSGGTITIKGGSVTARANTYSGYDNSQAIGVGQSNNAGTYALFLGNMKVYNNADATTPVASTDRESTCRSKYVRLTTCDHHYVNNECTYCGAEQNFIPIPYLVYDTESECFVQHTANVATYVKATTTTIGVAGSETYYAVKNDVTISSRIEVLGTVHLILCDGKTLTATGGITVHTGNTLNIHGQEGGTGTIVATSSGGNNAAIGTLADAYTLGTINFHGGTITATGGAWSAAIGGGVGCGGGTINIYGGHISATATNPNQGIQQAFGHGSSGPDVSLSIADGLRAYANNSSTPVAYNSRGSALHHKTAVVEPCTQHKQSGNTCTYCGIKICSVTYDANNATSGTVPTDANIYYINNTVTILGNTGNLERSGYFFAGWNTKADGSGVSYSEGATFTIRDNTTLYAMWMPLLELAANADNSNAINAAAANGKQHRVVLDGYTLYRDGTWNTLVLPFNLANLSGTPLEGFTVKTLQSSTLVNGELTLYFANANSIEAGKPYIVKWDQTPISNLVNPVFENVLISDAPANVSTTYADFIGSYAPITGDGLLVDAHNPNGDAMHAAIRAKLEGYSVSNYTQPDINFPATTIPFSADGNVTLWTICIPIDYSITYNLNGGTNHPGNPATYNIESTTITLQEPSKTNYIFGGWFDNEDCTGDAVTTIAHGSHGNVTLYAKWLAENLELVANGDNSSAISEAAASGRYCNVTLADCTIYTEGSWNTLCLPFSLASLTGTPLEGLTVKTLESSTFSDGTLTMNFSDATSIEAGKPYIVKRKADLVINSTTDWNTFAYNVMHEESYDGKLVRLGADITVNSTVGFDFDGGDSYAFKGTFDGCGHTLTINYTGKAVGPAPFMCAAGNYVIKNLIVAGTINTTENQAAGFVGNSYGNGTIRNCRSSVVIKSDYKGDAGEGGFVAMLNNSASLTMEDCVFDGKILTVGTNATTNCAGLVGYKHNGATLTMNNCLYAPAALTGSETAVSSGCATFARNASSFTNCYYTQTFGTAQGTNASGMSTAELLAALGSGWEIRDGQVFPKMNDNIVNPVFSNVLINTATANVETTYADFIGTYAPITDDGLLLDTHAPNGEAMHAAIRAKRESYTFEGWYSDAALTTPATAIPFATNGTVTIYTKWTPIEYSITYNLNGGTNHPGNPATYNIESANITLQAPEKSGYNFGGWFENEDCTGDAVTTIALGSHGNVTLYAKWTPILVLANNIDNSSAISSAAASGKYHSVILTDRTIYRDGDWNTLVLPFNLATLTGTPLEGFTVKTLESSTYSDGTLTMNFSDANSIEAGKPYIVKDNADLIIRSAADWNTFANNVNNGIDNYQGKVVKLVANISVTTMVGNSSNPFKGTFDGCGHTLNVSISGDNYTAPFSCVGAASIHNLKVDGSVTTTNGHPCGGLVGFINGALTITNCVSSVTFTSGYKGNAADGGILGLIDNNSGNVTIEDCAFMGKILTTNGTTDCGGIVGWRRSNGVTLTIKNCLYAPTALTVGETEPTSSCKTICRYSDPAPTITNCYYTRTLGDSQGTDASGMSNETLVGNLGSGWEIRDGQVVPKMADNIVNPVFSNVLISDATANISTDHANFIGSYAPITDTDLLLDAHNPNGDAMHAALRLTLSEPTRDGYTFGGWYTDNGFTTPLSTTIPFTADGNVTLYGKWLTEELQLTNNSNNSSAISEAAASGKYYNVTLADRTIYRDGDWNTLVLPFNLTSLTGTPLEGFTVKTLESSTFSDGTLTMNFSDANSIEAGKPYIVKDNADLIIRSAADWNTFANNVNNGIDNYQGKVVKLAADISVTTMVGTVSGSTQVNAFKGTFDGCGHTLVLNITDKSNQGTAPFRYISGVTIKNLKTTGTVTGNLHCSGLVGFASGTNSIQNCEVAVSVVCSGGNHSHCSGILGHGLSSTTAISDCLFSGSITGTTNTTGIIYGWGSNDGTHSIVNCLSAGTYTGCSGTIQLIANRGTWTCTNSYRKTSGPTDGTDASGMSNETLVGNLGSGWEIRDGQVVPKMNHDIVNPVFEEVLISNATAYISTDHANFIGSYAPITDTDLLLDAHNPDGDAMHAALRINLSEPTRDGYTFGGWCTDAGQTTPLSTTIPFATNGNVTLYGKWTPITYTVRFNKNHDDASGTMDDQQFTYGTEQALTANAFTAPTGYMFAGWSTTIDGAVEYTDGQSVSDLAIVQDAVVNLYAQWSEYCTLFAEGSTNQWMTWCDDDEWSVAAAPVKVYTVSGISGSTVTLTEEDSGCIPANTPLLIQRTDNSTSAITVPLRTKGTTASTLFAAAATDCTFYGNSTDQTITTGDYFTANQSYVLYGDKFLLVDTDGGIAPHRCLLTLTSPAGARRLNIILDDGSLPSKVLSVESEEKTDDWYTIDGRKLSQQPTKKGLYIYNGKKTVIK